MKVGERTEGRRREKEGGRRGELRREEEGVGKGGETTRLMCSNENCFSNQNSDSCISALESKDLNTYKSAEK